MDKLYIRNYMSFIIDKRLLSNKNVLKFKSKVY